MKVTRLGPPRPILNSGLGGNAGHGVPGGGNDLQVLTSDGSNGRYWGENVRRITSNGSNTLLSPDVNIAAGSNITFAIASNTLFIHGAAGGSGGSALTIKDEGTPLATDATSLDFVGAGVIASGAGAAKTITIAGSSGGTFPLGLAAPDKIPASPGAEDQEFEGTADTLPTDYAWVSTAPTFTINSDYPSWFVWERAASNTTEYKLRISNFAMAATSGLWVKMGNGTHNSATCQWEWIIYDSSSDVGYGAGIHNGNVYVARDRPTGGPIANRGTASPGGTVKVTNFIIGVMRVSDTWTTYLSVDGGVTFQCVQTADTRTFTVDRLEFRWSTDGGGGAYLSRTSIDWIRYRADNLFPKP